MEWLNELTFWHWWILAAVLLALETLVPGAIFLWMGIAAIVVGGLTYFIPGWGWEWEILVFAILSLASIFLWRAYLHRNPQQSDQPLLNQRGRQYIGRTFTLTEGIVNGMGKIRVDDSTWKVRGPDCPPGTTVIVNDVDGVVFEVAVKS